MCKERKQEWKRGRARLVKSRKEKNYGERQHISPFMINQLDIMGDLLLVSELRLREGGVGEEGKSLGTLQMEGRGTGLVGE